MLHVCLQFHLLSRTLRCFSPQFDRLPSPNRNLIATAVYLWPSLVLTNPSMRPISVALPIIERSTDLATFFAVLVVASIVPIVLFLIFQKPHQLRTLELVYGQVRYSILARL